MLTLTKETQMDKAKKTLREVASYADEVIRDERLRADIRAAVGHGAEASNRVKAELGADGMTTRLAADKKLRRSLRAMLDDLDHASERMRRKPRHRARNALLLLAGAVTAVAAGSKVRLWLAERRSQPTNVGSARVEPLT